MTATDFDTLAYANKLKAAGFTDQQAEAQAEALRAVADQNLATKQDLEAMQGELKRDIEALRRETEAMRTELKRDISTLRGETQNEFVIVRQELKQMESRITLRLGGLIVAGVVVLGVLMRVL